MNCKTDYKKRAQPSKKNEPFSVANTSKKSLHKQDSHGYRTDIPPWSKRKKNSINSSSYSWHRYPLPPGLTGWPQNRPVALMMECLLRPGNTL